MPKYWWGLSFCFGGSFNNDGSRTTNLKFRIFPGHFGAKHAAKLAFKKVDRVLLDRLIRKDDSHGRCQWEVIREASFPTFGANQFLDGQSASSRVGKIKPVFFLNPPRKKQIYCQMRPLCH